MKILVSVKRVPDPATTIRILPDGSGIATDNVKWVINPFDEIAIEEALRIKEKQGACIVDRRPGRYVSGDGVEVTWLLTRADWLARRTA